MNTTDEKDTWLIPFNEKDSCGILDYFSIYDVNVLDKKPRKRPWLSSFHLTFNVGYYATKEDCRKATLVKAKEILLQSLEAIEKEFKG